MHKTKLAVATSLFAFTLVASAYFTRYPYIAAIHYGGCVAPEATNRTPSSLIAEFIATGGSTKKTYPDTSQPEYGCALTHRRAILPVDLYALTLLSGATLIWALTHRPRRA
jgi:hypothetical protein